MRIIIDIAKSVPEGYWENWWLRWYSYDARDISGTVQERTVLVSGREQPAADTDLEVLQGRLASGLHQLPDVLGTSELPEKVLDYIYDHNGPGV